MCISQYTYDLTYSLIKCMSDVGYNVLFSRIIRIKLLMLITHWAYIFTHYACWACFLTTHAFNNCRCRQTFSSGFWNIWSLDGFISRKLLAYFHSISLLVYTFLRVSGLYWLEVNNPIMDCWQAISINLIVVLWIPSFSIIFHELSMLTSCLLLQIFCNWVNVLSFFVGIL